MDDGIELNFAPPSGPVVRQVSTSKKGGRWTDRVKARREAKDSAGGRPRDYAQTASTSTTPARASAPAPAPVAGRPAAPAPAPAPPARPQPQPRPRPVASPVSRPPPPPAARSPVSRPTPTEASLSRPAAPAPVSRPAPSVPAARPAPTQTSSPAKKSAPVSRPAPRVSYNQPTAGPSTTPGQPSAKSSGPGIISSLFTSNPVRPTNTKSAKPAPAYSGLPSNAPLAGDNSTFEGLGLDPLLIRHLKGKMGVERPTGIQRSALPYMLASPLDIDKRTDFDEDEGGVKQEEPEEDLRDIFIQSQTGSGKTLTYLLPIVQTLLPLSRLSYIDRSIGTLAIILAPTRELAQQISKVLEQLLSLSLSSEDDDEQYTRWLVSGLLTGGSTRTHEKARLRKGVPILVSTPGRLLDHLQNTTSFKCAKTMFLVLDEADRLMDLGFEETIHGIIRALEGRRKNEIAGEKEMDEAGGGVMRWAYWSRGRRTVLCSATADAKVEKLAGNALRNPITFRAEPEIPKTNPKTEEKVQEALADANAISLPMADEEKFTPPSQLSQKYVVVPTKLRLVSLVATLRSLISAAKGEGLGTKIIVFLSSTDAVDFHWKLLGGVQMGEPEPAPEPEAKIEDQEEDEDEDGESADEDEEDGSTKPKSKSKFKPTEKSKPTQKPKAKPQEELIALTSALFPKTTLYRLHGSLPLRTRLASLAGFSASSPSHSILLATSVASRGLDLPLVRAVVQYDLPTEGGANEYVHRVGRTARAGKGGEAWSFVGPSEEPWVEWVQGKMGKAESKSGAAGGGGGGGVRLNPVTVDDVLKKGFGGKGWEYEQRATDVQLGFERWVLSNDQNATLARRAFSSYIRAYSTHPAEEKRFFHPKSIHLGHLAKSFALREAPSSLTTSGPKPSKPTTSATTNNNKRKRAAGNRGGAGAGEDGDSDDEHGGKEKTARNETEARMYAAVRKAGKQIRSQGKMGQFGGGAGDSEFQIVNTKDVERMVSDKSLKR